MTYLLLFLSVVTGYLVALFLQKREIKNIEVFMAFSGAFLLSITVFELLPEVFKTPSKRIGLFIMGGILLQLILEFFSKGAEHGHIHTHSTTRGFPWLLFLSLCVHAFIEGFPISETNNLLLAVVVHKVPVAIILSFFFMQAGFSTKNTLLFLFFFALMTPLGNYISHHFESISKYEVELNALVIGIFFHVSTTILFESSKNHSFHPKKMAAVLLAVFLAYLV